MALQHNIKNNIVSWRSKSAKYWEQLGVKNVVMLSNCIVRSVPAYKKFLTERGVANSAIKNLDDLDALPVADKNNYLRVYPYLDLFPEKKVAPGTISLTSGSTGEPFFFPRGPIGDEQYRFFFRDVFK